MSVSWSRVLASAAVVRLVKVAAMGTTIVQIVISVGGSWGSGLALGAATIVGAGGWCWGCRRVLSGEGLGYALLESLYPRLGWAG